MPYEKNAGIFVSGDGTTMESGPLSARKVDRLGVIVPVVVSSNPNALALERAKEHKIHTEIVNPREYRINGKFKPDGFNGRVIEISDNYELDMAIHMGWKV